MQSVIDFPWNYSHVDDTKLVHTGSCVLHTITINRCDADITWATLYDGIDNTGTVVAVIDLDIDPEKTYHVLPTTLIFDCKLLVGCYIEFNAQPSTASLTVNYK